MDSMNHEARLRDIVEGGRTLAGLDLLDVAAIRWALRQIDSDRQVISQLGYQRNVKDDRIADMEVLFAATMDRRDKAFQDVIEMAEKARLELAEDAARIFYRVGSSNIGKEG
jgi:hypothetical protein